MATSLNNLANLYYREGWYGQAGPLFERALSILKRHPDAEQSDLSAVLKNLAILYTCQKRYTQAENILSERLAIEEVSGNSQRIAEALRDLAHVYPLAGRYADAEPLLQRWLDVSKAIEGTADSEVAAVLREQAFMLRKLRRKPEAARIEARARAISELNKAPRN